MRKLFLLAVSCLLVVLSTKAQMQEVTGKIVDSTGTPIAGASIRAKGVRAGYSAGSDGSFRIPAPKGGVLVITAVGYGAREVRTNGNGNLTITLSGVSRMMNEVVVTAIGISREKRELGSATQTINADQLNKTGTGNALSELNGKASGLTVINSSGDPGAGTYVRLRGVTSITGNNQPLMIVDGVPIDNSINNYDPTSSGAQASGPAGNLLGGAQPTNRGVDLNPNDIESVTLLKGPAATALYGIQAASGAVIITTKKGSVGQGPALSFNSSFTVDKVSRLPERQNIYSQGNNGKYAGPSSSGSAKRLSWGARIDSLYFDGIPNDYDRNGAIVGASNPSRKTKARVYDPYDFFQTGLTYNNNIALSGGSGKSAYRMSLGNLHQTGIIPKTKYDKTTFSINGQTVLSDKFNISGAVNFIRSANDKAQQGSNTSGVMLGLLRTPPTFDNSNGLKNPADNPASYLLSDGVTQRDYRGGLGYDNPFWTVNRDIFHDDLIRTYGYAQANYQVFNWMTVSYKLGGDVYSQNDKNAYDIGSNAFAAGAVHLSNYLVQQYNSDLTVSMKHTFSDALTGSLLLGQNYFTFNNHTKLSHGTGLVLPNFLDMANATSYTTNELDSRKRTSAWYGEAHLTYQDMLFLTVTGRRETSSTLPAKNNSFFYPSVSLAWEFYKSGSSSEKALSYGKLRASFAQVGKDAPTQGLNTYYTSATISDGFTNGLIFPIDGNAGYQLGSPVAVIGNPNLKAEKTNSYELGADLGFLKGRVSLNATAYYSKSSDVILTVPIAYSTGFAAELLNAATITNKGLELTLNTTPVRTKDWRWDVNFNWARNVNLVKSLAAGVDKVFIAGFNNGEIDAVAGQPFGVIFGSSYVRSNPADRNSPWLINDDKNDPGYGMPIVSQQNAALAKIDPDWTGSVVSNVSYRNFSLSVQVDVRHGGHIWNGTRGAMDYFGTGRETANRGQATTFKGLAGHLDANGNVVHFEGTAEVAKSGGQNQVVTAYNEYYWQNIGSSFVGPAEASVEGDGFVRVRQASLGYQLPAAALKKLHLKAVSITAYTNNPLLWTKYKGVDPETSLAGPANGQGLDYFNNPGAKSYGLRLNLGL
ncbi:MAG: SusC/RagA family TonB-linked outer membrane protein [Sphingobacteriales bacterium]|nr:SusC/RagA family TonB-linked outer membrane protein [Sphingobacteriales bacterium]